MRELPQLARELNWNKQRLDQILTSAKEFLAKEAKEAAIIVFIDMSGSTSLSVKDPDTYRLKVAQLFKLVEDIVDKANVSILQNIYPLKIPKTMGDGIMIVRCFGERRTIVSTHVLETCQCIVELASLLEEQEIHVKVAITKGTGLLKGDSIRGEPVEGGLDSSLTLSSDDLWGNEVNKCARIESFAGRGQILISEEIEHSLRNAFKLLRKKMNCNAKTTTGSCDTNCERNHKGCTKEPRFRIVGLTPPYPGYANSQYVIAPKGFKEPFSVRQVALQVPRAKSHILSNYRFGCFLTVRCDYLNDANYPRIRETRLKEVRKAFEKEFPWPQVVTLYDVDRQTLFSIAGGHLKRVKEPDKSRWDVAAILVTTDFYDFSRRMARLTSCKTNTHLLFDYTSSHPLFDIEYGDHGDDITFVFDSCSLYNWKGLEPDSRGDAPELRLDDMCHYWAVKLSDQQGAADALKKLNKMEDFLDGWLSLGFYDLVMIQKGKKDIEDGDAEDETQKILSQMTRLLKDENLYGEAFIGNRVFPPIAKKSRGNQ